MSRPKSPLHCKCGEKAPENFYPSFVAKGGSQYCKKCFNEKMKGMNKRWRETPEGKAKFKAAQERYRKTEKGRAADTRSSIKYNAKKRAAFVAQGLTTQGTPRVNRAIKPYLCRICGQDDPSKFLAGTKTFCSHCYQKEYRARAVPRCGCGETDPENFYPSSPKRCKECYRRDSRIRSLRNRIAKARIGVIDGSSNR